MQSRIDDISKIIKEQIRHYESKTAQDEIGYVISVGDGISKVHGLEKCKANELLEFSNGSYGMALNLEETFVSCVLLGNDVGIKEGSIVKRTSLPNPDDVRAGVVAFKIAAHAADVALKKPGARAQDDAISDARQNFDWEAQFANSIDPARARELREEALRESSSASAHDGKYCTMCGPDFCSVRLSAKLKKLLK